MARTQGTTMPARTFGQDVINLDGQPEFGVSGSPENPDIFILSLLEGVGTLGAVADRLERYANYARDLEQRGWQLAQVTEQRVGQVQYTRTGTPPAEDCMLVDCPVHGTPSKI